MATDNETTGAQVIADLLERIDKLTQHVINMRGDMYKRGEAQVDLARVYDQITTVQAQILMALKEAVLNIEKRQDHFEMNFATREALDGLQLRVRDMVPRSEHSSRWEQQSERFSEIEAKLELVAKRALPTWVIGGVGTLFGAIASAVAGQAFGTILHTHPGK